MKDCLGFARERFALIGYILCLVFCLTLAGRAALGAQSEYTAHDLGGLTPKGINNSDVVVGYGIGYSNNPFWYALVYSNGVVTALGGISGSNTIAYAINDAGTIVGEKFLGDGRYHAFSYSNGVMTDLGTLGGSNSIAYGINRAGIIVGYSDVTNWIYPSYHAFSYSNGVMTDLGTLPGHIWSAAYAINDAGVIVGDSSGANLSLDHTASFIYSNGVMSNLGSFGGGETHAFGVNAAGEVAGYSIRSDGTRYNAFLYRGGTMTNLGGMYAFGINDCGTIVGANTRATRYSSGVWTDLSSYLVGIGIGTNGDSRACAINDAGSIAGYGSRGFLLTRDAPAILADPPLFSNAAVRISFSISSGSADSFTLLQASQPTGYWSMNAAAVLWTNAPGISYTFVAPVAGDGARFFRVRSP